MNSIKYIGVDDLDIDLFESQYIVPEGMSYNSYLIDDEKIAIMDTADRRKADEWKKNLTKALAGRKPHYLVAHHMEPDHASLIAEVLGTYPELQLVCSAQALKMLPNFFDGFPFEGRVLTVKEGDTLSLGSHTLHFIAAPMVHWPEVLMSYEDREKVLFAADGFGKFGALSKEQGARSKRIPTPRAVLLPPAPCPLPLIMALLGPAKPVATTSTSAASTARRCRTCSGKPLHSTYRPSVRSTAPCSRVRPCRRL